MKTLLIATLATFWCKAEPVTTNGDDYLARSSSIEESCYKALKRCEEHYHDCEITHCGEGHSINYDDTGCMY